MDHIVAFAILAGPPFLSDGGNTLAWSAGLATVHVTEGLLWLA